MEETKLQKSSNLPRQNFAAKTSKQSYYEIFDSIEVIIENFSSIVRGSSKYSDLWTAELCLNFEVHRGVQRKFATSWFKIILIQYLFIILTCMATNKQYWLFLDLY